VRRQKATPCEGDTCVPYFSADNAAVQKKFAEFLNLKKPLSHIQAGVLVLRLDLWRSLRYDRPDVRDKETWEQEAEIYQN
ncbi:hypothetical protein CYMTET_49454, partial [Cymbomonas tetramitiformis]